MSTVALVVLASALLAADRDASPAHLDEQQGDAALGFIAGDTALTGVSFGLTAVDGQSLLWNQRTNTYVASGRRTIWYACPGAEQMSGGSRLTFDFDPGQQYVLVCRSGEEALIRISDGC